MLKYKKHSAFFPLKKLTVGCFSCRHYENNYRWYKRLNWGATWELNKESTLKTMYTGFAGGNLRNCSSLSESLVTVMPAAKE